MCMWRVALDWVGVFLIALITFADLNYDQQHRGTPVIDSLALQLAPQAADIYRLTDFYSLNLASRYGCWHKPLETRCGGVRD